MVLLWWILVPLAASAFAEMMNSVSKEDRRARENWARQHKQIEKSISEHRRNVKHNIKVAQRSLDFHFLRDLHYSSFRIADNAYKLMSDARTSKRTMYRILEEARKRIRSLNRKLDNEQSVKANQEISEEISEMKEFRSSILQDLQKVESEEVRFKEEVNRLNMQTMELKQAIRERCGRRGREWYDRLVARKMAQ